MPTIILNNVPFLEDDINDDERNAALGRFMTAWAQVEVICGFLFRRFTDLDAEASTIIFDNVGNKEQIEMLLLFADLMPSEADGNRIAEHLNMAKAISVQRNKIVHASWGQLDEEPARFWSGLTSKHIELMTGGGQKGASILGKFVFTVSRLKTLADETLHLRKLLEGDLELDFPAGPQTRRMDENRRMIREFRDELLKEQKGMRAS